MAKLTGKEAMKAVEPAAVVVIGAPLIQAIPIVGSLLGKLPSYAVGPTAIAFPSIIAGAVAVIAYGLIKARLT